MKTSLKALEKQIRKCKKCSLWRTRKNAVPGEGKANAKIMLIGQNPGAEEDKAGKPFIGRSGKYLNRVLEKNKINRKNLFICGAVKCKTPKNRKPSSEEIKACMPYLLQQIKIINPKIIVLMGEVAWQTSRKIKNIKYIETYHPAAAMRFPKIRKKFEKDFRKLKCKLK